MIPVGDRDDQELRVIIEAATGALTIAVATQCRFVPLRGGEGWR